MAERPASKLGTIKQLTDEDLQGMDLEKIKCRSCSGYGNCGFKKYNLYKGSVVSICQERKQQEMKRLGLSNE